MGADMRMSMGHGCGDAYGHEARLPRPWESAQACIRAYIRLGTRIWARVVGTDTRMGGGGWARTRLWGAKQTMCVGMGHGAWGMGHGARGTDTSMGPGTVWYGSGIDHTFG